MQKLRKFLRFSLADQALLLETALLIVGVRAALSPFRFQTIQALLARMGKPVQETAADTNAPDIQKIIWAVDVTGYYLLRERPCLTKALVARMLLSRKGYQTSLRIGVAYGPTRSLQSHAWLERDGEIVVGDLKDLGRFTPLPPLEVASRKLKAS